MYRDHRTTGSPSANDRPGSEARDLCPCCQGARTIYEPSILGLVPVVCAWCMGSGRRAVSPVGP